MDRTHVELLQTVLSKLDTFLVNLPQAERSAFLSELESGAAVVWGIDSRQLWFEFNRIRYGR